MTVILNLILFAAFYTVPATVLCGLIWAVGWQNVRLFVTDVLSLILPGLLWLALITLMHPSSTEKTYANVFVEPVLLAILCAGLQVVRCLCGRQTGLSERAISAISLLLILVLTLAFAFLYPAVQVQPWG